MELKSLRNVEEETKQDTVSMATVTEAGITNLLTEVCKNLFQ
jgi:hypothetical protein